MRWDPDAGTIDAAGLEGVDAVVHLAGAGIGDKKWTPARKQLILESRTAGHRPARPHAGRAAAARRRCSSRARRWATTATAATRCSPRPRRPATTSRRRSCVAWEAATAPAAEAGIRVVHLRTGIVLAAHGGALQRMLLPFKLGLGGRLGSGEQYMSWITLDDHVGAIRHLSSRADRCRGAGQPHRARTRRPTRSSRARSARALHRPTVLPTPLFPLKAVYGGELVDTLLVHGQRVAAARARSERLRVRRTPTSTTRCAPCWRHRLRRDVTPQPEPRVG